MSVAKVTEIISSSKEGFDDAVKQGIKPNIMAISTLMLAVSIAVVAISWTVGRMGTGRERPR